MAEAEDSENIPGPRKAAIFLMAMGEEYTTKVFEKLSEREISDLAFEMSSIGHITPEMMKAVSLDFVEKFEGEAKMIIETDSFIKNVVKNTLKDKQANAILDDLEGTSGE